MKIAIPTNDKLNIENSIESTNFFKLFTIEKAEIISEAYIKNKKGKSNEILKDNSVDILIVKNTNFVIDDKKIQVIQTQENIITNAVCKFLNELIRKESDYCCSP